jgi:hypothetical protein
MVAFVFRLVFRGLRRRHGINRVRLTELLVNFLTMSGRLTPTSDRLHLQGFGLGRLDVSFGFGRPSASGYLLSLSLSLLNPETLVLGDLTNLGGLSTTLLVALLARSPCNCAN